MQEDRALAPATHALARRLFLLALGTFAIGTDVFVFAGILRDIARDLGLSVAVTGQIATAYALTYALAPPLLAAASAGWRRERVIVLALAAFAAADALSALAPSYALLLAARVLAAGCAALYVPSAYSLAAALAPEERRGAALAAVVLGTTSALVLSVPLGAWIGHQLGWRWSFVLAGALAALGALALAQAGLPKLPPAPVPRFAARFAPLAQPAVVLVLLAQLCWSTGNYTIYIYSAVLLGARVGVDNMAGLLLVCGVGAWLGTLAGGRLADRFGTAVPTIALVLLNALNIALMNLTGGTLAGAGAALFVFGVTGWAVIPAQQSRLMRLAPAHAALAVSLLTSTAYIGSAAGAALGGLLIAHAVAAAPLVASAGIVAGLALFLLGLNAERAKAAIA